jgi:hypothetical protein
MGNSQRGVFFFYRSFTVTHIKMQTEKKGNLLSNKYSSYCLIEKRQDIISKNSYRKYEESFIHIYNKTKEKEIS